MSWCQNLKSDGDSGGGGGDGCVHPWVLSREGFLRRGITLLLAIDSCSWKELSQVLGLEYGCRNWPDYPLQNSAYVLPFGTWVGGGRQTSLLKCMQTKYILYKCQMLLLTESTYFFLAALGSVAARGSSPVALSGHYSLVNMRRLLMVASCFWAWASVVVMHKLSCSTACGIFLDQGSNPCPLHWQADS